MTAFAWMSRLPEVTPAQEARRTSALGVTLAEEVDRASEAHQRALTLHAPQDAWLAATLIYGVVLQAACKWIADGTNWALDPLQPPAMPEGRRETDSERLRRFAWNDLPEPVQCELAAIYNRVASPRTMAARPKIRDVVPPAAEMDPQEETLSPATILRVQAETWTERTNGEIIAELEPVRASSDRIGHWFSFVVPALDNYRHRLFRVEHGIEFYPLRIASSRGGEEVAEVGDDDRLYDVLQRIFAAPATLNIVRQLRSMIAEQRAAGGAGRG
jgi:hypothetical protein